MLNILMKSVKWIAISLVALVIALTILIWSITFHPPALQDEGACAETWPTGEGA